MPTLEPRPMFISIRPIAGEIPVENAGEHPAIKANVQIGNLEFRPQQNAFGENRTAELDFDYSVYLEIWRIISTSNDYTFELMMFLLTHFITSYSASTNLVSSLSTHLSPSLIFLYSYMDTGILITEKRPKGFALNTFDLLTLVSIFSPSHIL